VAGYTVIGVDQTGLAQKGGAVVSHLRFAADRDSAGAASVGREGADLYLSGDIFQAASSSHLERIKPGRTVAVIEGEITPTAAMLQNAAPIADWSVLRTALSERVAQGRLAFIDSKHIADAVFADAILANVILLGAAFQLGGLPFSIEAIDTALKQNRSAEKNRAAFQWGRWAVHDAAALQTALAAVGKSTDTTAVSQFEPSIAAVNSARTLLAARRLPVELSDLLTRRTAQVIDYQSSTLAHRYLALLERAATQDSSAEQWKLTRAMAEGWFKLLTYKDEYEVARLHTATNYEAIARELGIEGEYTVRYHLQPEFIGRLGIKGKVSMGKPFALLFRGLRRLKWVRGTLLDPIGWTSDRRLERQLVRDYEQMIGEVLGQLPYAVMVELAASVQNIKGYGSVKARNVAAWRTRVAELRRSSNQPMS
jgi:indolepyruvate ferredoxin oxidoreductase